MGSKPLGLKSIFSWALNIVVGANRRDLLPFSTGTIVYVFDNNNAKRYHCVKNSDTLTVFELYDYTIAGGIVGSRNSWNDFIDLNNKTL